MITLDLNTWSYKGYDVYKAIHPKLIGKYEVYKGETFIDRVYTLKEAKKLIDTEIKKPIQVNE